MFNISIYMHACYQVNNNMGIDIKLLHTIYMNGDTPCTIYHKYKYKLWKN